MGVRNPQKLKDGDWAEKLLNLHFIRIQEKESSQKT